MFFLLKLRWWGWCSSLPLPSPPRGAGCLLLQCSAWGHRPSWGGGVVTMSSDGCNPSDGCKPVGSGTSLLSAPRVQLRQGPSLPGGKGGRHPFREDQLISHLTGFPSERPSLWARGGPCIQALAGVPLTPAGAPVSGYCDSLATCPGRPQAVCLAGGPCDEVVRTAPGALRPELGRD